MKQYILILFFLIFAGTQQTYARISIGQSEKLKVVHELPNTEDYMSNPGRFMDLGIKYETFDMIGMPLWLVKDPVFIGLENHNTSVYFDLDDKLVNDLIAENKLDRKELMSLTFFDQHLGIIVIIGIIIAFVIYNLLTKRREDDITIIEEESDKNGISN